VKSEVVNVNEGELVDYLQEIISQGSFSTEIAGSPADRLLELAKDMDVVISHLPSGEHTGKQS